MHRHRPALQLLLSEEYPDYPPEWRLLGAWQVQQPGLLSRPPSSSATRLSTPTHAGGQAAGKLPLHTSSPALGAALRALEEEVNVAVPARVPQVRWRGSLPACSVDG